MNAKALYENTLQVVFDKYPQTPPWHI